MHTVMDTNTTAAFTIANGNFITDQPSQQFKRDRERKRERERERDMERVLCERLVKEKIIFIRICVHIFFKWHYTTGQKYVMENIPLESLYISQKVSSALAGIRSAPKCPRKIIFLLFSLRDVCARNVRNLQVYTYVGSKDCIRKITCEYLQH